MDARPILGVLLLAGMAACARTSDPRVYHGDCNFASSEEYQRCAQLERVPVESQPPAVAATEITGGKATAKGRRSVTVERSREQLAPPPPPPRIQQPPPRPPPRVAR